MTEALEYRAVETVEFRVGDGDDGTFEGFACRYGRRDSYGTTFQPGVFHRGIDRRDYALLFMHDPTRPVGTFRAEERDDHLYITGRYDDTAAGRDARTMARSGSAPELSVGFVRTDLPDWDKLSQMSDEDRADTVENIRGARLVEVSQITARMAAVPGSKLKTVRSVLGALYEEIAAPAPPSLDEQATAEQQGQTLNAQRLAQRRRRAALLRLTGVS
ncbi:HK97 family phage prohead protease [Streptomyces sp. NPDC093097]|uniref:HK97 family phage prohead protease n=1 Tax=Streptomyces sp. NPDC093097 TaxID=3366027 RepID=UPI003828990C